MPPPASLALGCLQTLAFLPAPPGPFLSPVHSADPSLQAQTCSSGLLPSCPARCRGLQVGGTRAVWDWGLPMQLQRESRVPPWRATQDSALPPLWPQQPHHLPRGPGSRQCLAEGLGEARLTVAILAESPGTLLFLLEAKSPCRASAELTHQPLPCRGPFSGFLPFAIAEASVCSGHGCTFSSTTEPCPTPPAGGTQALPGAPCPHTGIHSCPVSLLPKGRAQCCLSLGHSLVLSSAWHTSVCVQFQEEGLRAPGHS